MVRTLIIAAMLASAPANALITIEATNSSVAGASNFNSVGRDANATTVVGESFVAIGDGILRSFSIKLGEGTQGKFAFELAAWNGTTATGGQLYRSSPLLYTGAGVYGVSHIDLALTVGASYIGFVTSSGIENPIQSVAVVRTLNDTYSDGGLFGQATGGRSPLYGPTAGQAWTAEGGDAVFTAVFGATAADRENPNAHLGVIPEPGTWALLMAGFGLVGAALRRRRASFSVAQP